MRIAMWSGPRNLSTAMMYSFGARADFAIMDEPFYAPYLAVTGADHPMRDQIIGAHECDPAAVAQACSEQGTPHLYMKHMPHHMVEGFPLDWAKDCVNIHLIRHPARVIASYAAKRDAPTLDDIGFVQQGALFQQLGGLVIDSTDTGQRARGPRMGSGRRTGTMQCIRALVLPGRKGHCQTWMLRGRRFLTKLCRITRCFTQGG